MQAWTVWALGHAGSRLDGQPAHMHNDPANEVRRTLITDLLSGSPLAVYVHLHPSLPCKIGKRFADCETQFPSLASMSCLMIMSMP